MILNQLLININILALIPEFDIQKIDIQNKIPYTVDIVHKARFTSVINIFIHLLSNFYIL